MKFLITGANGGIGKETCDYLASQGHDLIIVSRRMETLSPIKMELEAHYKIQIYPYTVDYSNTERTTEFSKKLIREFPSIDGAVLIYPRIERPKTSLPPIQDWENNFLTCFVRPLETIKSAISIMPRGGKIVVVSGTASTQAFPQRPLANVIRSAWLAQVKTMAFEFGRTGIRINTVSLGGFLTQRIQGEVARRSRDESKTAQTEGQDLSRFDVFLREDELNALGTFGSPKDAAKVIGDMLFGFSDHITGANIICDGGYSRHY